MTTEQERTEGLELQKVGIQILSDEGLANIFPNYEDLLDNIEKCRKRICQANRKGHYQYNLMYDNVFSIIGKRGTGKTSAIFTLKKLIEEKSVQEQTQDLLLPIIMPELFSGKDGILEWILAGLEDEVDRIEKNVQKSDAQQFYQACRYPMDKQSNLLRKKYEQLLEQKFSDKYKAESADSYYEAIGNSAKQVKNSYQLIKNIYEFWDILIESIQNTSGMEKHMKEPLIYFFFDDIDLSPDKVEELLTAIRVYLAHPNLIVIITADEDVFLEVIENKMDEKMGRLQKDKRKYLWVKTNETFYDSYGMFYPTVNPMKENAEDGLSDMAR
ncbi:MAG: KAP family NTPase, partial [Eubacterium sp.]|nr:KAP family NTPase [Eubacterium sp.]